MAGFGSLAPGEDWQDQEARANLAAINAAKPSTGSWFDSIRAGLAAPGRIVGALASTPVENADAGAMMPETYVNPLVKGAMDAAGGAITSGVTAPHDALYGQIPIYDAEGHISPEMVRRGFDTAALAGGGGAAGTLSADSAKAGAAVAAAEHAPAFNLTAEEALKNTARKSGTGAQWSNELRRYGAKPEELDWRGATDMLTKNANVPISRSAVEQHLAGNPFEVKPVDMRQMPADWKDLTLEQQHALADKYNDLGARHNQPPLPEWYANIAEHSRIGNETGIDSIFKTPQYTQYQLPGGENYRERLLTLPRKITDPTMATKFLRGELNGDPAKFGFDTPEKVVAEAQRRGYEGGPSEGSPVYKSSHWEEPNVLVHRRTTDRELPNETGAPSKSVHAEEIQSDWHQAGQNKGYRGAAEDLPRPRNFTDFLAERGITDPADVRRLWNDRHSQEGISLHNAHLDEVHDRYRAIAMANEGVPNAPFKDSWHRLALNDMIREAAEKGADEISWTAGRSQPTNPKNLNPNTPPDVAAKAEAGLVKHYDEKLVNAANKIGKARGVSVSPDSLGDRYRLVDAEGKPGQSFDSLSELNGWRERNPAARQYWPGEEKLPGKEIFRMKIPQSLKDQALKKGFSLFEDAGPASAAVQLAAHAGEGNVGAKIAGSDVGRGAGGGDAGLAEAAAAATRRAGTATPLPGLPTKAMKIGDEHFVPGPIGSIRDVAKSYMRGRDPAQFSASFPERYHDIEPARSAAIAKAFDEMKHAPNDPRVKASYDAMVRETRDQFDHLMKSGLKVSPITGEMADPYALNPRLAAKDAGDNHHLWFFPTEQGFGTGSQGGIDLARHPMMQPSGRELNGKPLLNNDLFRIVHDYFGHLKEGYGFRGAGEDNAWRSHAAMYSDQARPAMTTETRGQNSWVNYGPHGETNRKASAADTKYADQKVGLMPDWTMGEGYPGKPDWQEALRGIAHQPAAPAIRKTSLVDERGLPVQGAAYTKEARSVLDDIARGPKGAGPMDLSTQGRVPDVPQTPLPRYEPPRGVSERMQEALKNPDVKKGVAASIKKGMPVADWYHTEPVRRAFFGELGPVHGEKEFGRFMDTVAATSPRSDVPTNIRNASYYYGQGSPENLPPKNPYPFGHVAQNLHRQNFETISGAGGWDPFQNPKPASFAANLKGNLSPVTVDTHAFRNIAMRTGDPRFLETSISQKYKPGVNRGEDTMVKKYGELRGDTVTFRPQKLYKEGKLTLEEAKNIPSFWAAKPKDNEYAAAENLFRDLARRAKLSPADAQAAAWAGAGDLTGLGTVGTHTFPELMNERVLFTSRMRGESPQKTLSDLVRGKKPLLSDASAGVPFGALAQRPRDDR